MNEMIERIARAIYGDLMTSNHPAVKANRPERLGIARAVLAAMREPTQEMSDTANVDIDEHTSKRTLIEAGWRAMTESMVEQVARAIRREEHRECCIGAALDDICALPVSEKEARAARAAIAAMREPIEAMLSDLGASSEWDQVDM